MKVSDWQRIRQQGVFKDCLMIIRPITGQPVPSTQPACQIDKWRRLQALAMSTWVYQQHLSHTCARLCLFVFASVLCHVPVMHTNVYKWFTVFIAHSFQLLLLFLLFTRKMLNKKTTVLFDKVHSITFACYSESQIQVQSHFLSSCWFRSKNELWKCENHSQHLHTQQSSDNLWVLV